MTELSFLISLLLNDDVTKPVKLLIADRIKEVEARPGPVWVNPQALHNIYTPVSSKSAQSPSTQRILDEMAAEGQPVAMIERPAMPGEVSSNEQNTIIASTPAAAQALAARQQAIANATSGRSEKGRTSPRKF